MSFCKKEKLDCSKCVVPNCDNGKHNNHILFGIPKNSDRQKIWLEAIGNPSLMKYSALHVRKAGVCKNHFYADSFMDSEKKKLRPLANPVNLNVPQIAQLRASILNLSVKQNNQETSSKQIISYKDYCNNTDNHRIRDVDKKQDEGKAPKTLYYSGKDMFNTCSSIDKMNSNYEPHVFLNNCALEDNMTQVFRKPKTDNSQNSIINNTLYNNKLKEKISVLEEENIMLKKKLTNFAKINRDKIALVQKFNSLQKKIARQEKQIISLCKEINSLRK